MRPLGVVEVYPFCDDPHRCEAVGQLLQVDGLVFERPPQAFDKYVVHAAAPPIHGDCNARVLEDAGEVEAGELASLVGVEDIRAAAAIQGFSQRLDAEGGIHAVRRPPSEHMAGRPVHDSDQVVRRHIIWHNLRPDLKEDLAHLVQDIPLRICYNYCFIIYLIITIINCLISHDLRVRALMSRERPWMVLYQPV
jgi:hypothetical protein